MLYYESSTRQRHELPPIGRLTVSEARHLFDDRARYDDPIRVIDLSICRRAEMYDEGHQFIETVHSSHPYQWEELDPGADRYSVPLPVLNEGALQRQNETARLGRPEYQPAVRPNVPKPSLKVRMGARKATDVLKSELKRMDFEGTRLEGEYHQPLYGGWTLLSMWDQRWDQSVNVPVRTAKACPRHPGTGSGMVSSINPDQAPGPGLDVGPPSIPSDNPQTSTSCSFVVADPQTPLATIESYGGPLAEAAAGAPAEMQQVDRCPLCPDHPALVPYQPTPEEAQGADAFGRPLNEFLPRGEWVLRNGSPYDIWWENGGVDIRNGGEELVWVHVESLDWVALRYPHKAREVRPESPTQLSRYHPVAGSPSYRYQTGTTAIDIFRNHVRVKEFHKRPWMEWDLQTRKYRYNLGRSIVVANNVLLFDGPLLIRSLTNPEKYVPRMTWGYSAWEPRAGGRRIQGISQWEYLWDAQDGLNECASQRAAVRQRLAVPVYLKRKAMNLGQPGLVPGLPGVWLDYTPDTTAPQERPVLINNETIDTGVVEELESHSNRISRLGGKNEIEGGNVPTNVAAATAISMLKTESAEHRRPRVARNRKMLAAAWTHGLQLCAALWIEPRPYATEDTHGNESWKALVGLDLYDQTNVEILPEPAFDTEDEKRENVRDLISLKLMDVQDPAVRRTLLRLLNAPQELYAKDEVQEEAAEREYNDFIDNGKFPVLDPTLDDHALHYDRHGLDCHTEEFRDLAEAAGWDEALSIIGHTFTSDLMALPASVGRPWPVLDAATGQFVQVQQQAMATIPVTDPQTGAPVPDPKTGQPATSTQPAIDNQGQPIIETVPKLGPPKPLQEMIVDVWVDLLSKSGFRPKDVPEGLELMSEGAFGALGAVLRWRAHMEAHKLQALVGAVSAQPQMPAPGQVSEVSGGGAPMAPGLAA